MAELMYNIEKFMSLFEEADFIQLKFLAQYENDPLVRHLFPSKGENISKGCESFQISDDSRRF